MIAIWILLTVVILALLISYICYRMAFHALPGTAEEYAIPDGEIYEPYREQMVAWMKEARQLVTEEVSIVSFDGLRLYGKYYEYEPGAPMELMFHGYRGSAERDLCGGVQRCFALGRSCLIVDQRTSEKSEGHVISFGINERRDCLAWIDFAIEHFGPEVRIILTGISMGAATVMMAAGEPLPKQVKGVLADCGYTSAREIICKTIREMKLPVTLAYPFVKMGARVFGRFDLEETSPIEAMARSTVPVIFIHGEADDFVPCDMSRRNYDACTAPKMLFTVPGAGHGLSYLLDREGYLNVLAEFWAQIGLPTKIVEK